MAGDGKVYHFSETGEIVAFQAGRELHVYLGERLVWSPAVFDERAGFFIGMVQDLTITR